MDYQDVYNNHNNQNNSYPAGGYPDGNYQQFSQQCAFDGTGGDFFGLLLLNTLLLIISCGFAYPWVICNTLKWKKSHTIIGGRRLAFTGQPGDLLGKWLIWWLLSLVTCGIYSIWLSVRIKEWEISHTCFADMNPVDGQTFEDSYYDGDVGERFGQQLVSNLLMSVTCGIYQPWAVVQMTTYDTSHTVINGYRLGFKGTGSGYWGENAIVGLLLVVTCGFYGAWGVCRINQWVYRNTYVASIGNFRM